MPIYKAWSADRSKRKAVVANDFAEFLFKKIKRSTMYNSYENGGFKVPNLKYFCMAQKVTWIKKILDDQFISDWKTMFLSNVETYGGNYIWLCKDNSPKFLTALNPFWTDVYKVWIAPSLNRPEEPQKEPIFHNESIKIGISLRFES